MGFRQWIIDNGPVSFSDSKDIELGKNVPMNERVANIAAAFRFQLTNRSGAAWDEENLSVAELLEILDSLVSWKFVVGGKTLWTLSASELIILSIYKTRSIPTLGGLLDVNGNINSAILDGVADDAATTGIGECTIFFHFNQPQAMHPSLLAPGTAQLKGATLTWSRGAATGFAVAGAANAAEITNVADIRLIQSLAFERGYFVAPLAFIDKPNLANKVTPISGGFIPNVLALPAATSVDAFESYSTAYGEELHGMKYRELQNCYSENGKTTFEMTNQAPFFVPVKYLPLNAGVDEFLPSPLGESLEVETPTAGNFLLVERYVPTNEFIPAVNAKLGALAVGSSWEMAGIPSQVYSAVPNEYMEYMPKKLVLKS